jgi:OPT oligopeptide transporter protein
MVYLRLWSTLYAIYSTLFLVGLSFFFLVGFAAPFLTWLISLRWPNSWLRYVNWPVILSGVGLIPPASAVNYVPWAIVGFIFQYVIRRRHFSWWTKYNYVLSASMDSGVAISIVVIFFWYGSQIDLSVLEF